MSFLDVHTEVVAASGRRTSATVADWEEWAGEAAGALRDVAGEACDDTVTGAVESYLSRINSAMHSVARQVDALGTNTVSASNSVANSDTMAAGMLARQGHRTDGLTSALNRPINL